MAEAAFERRFCKYARALGFHVTKYVDSSRTGAPDRLLLGTKGLVAFVELKDRGEEPRADQLDYILWLTNRGFDVAWFDPSHDWKGWLEDL